jgi:hypothetical protein
MDATTRFPCPCCGYRVFREPPGSFDICPICYWEDDIVQLAFPQMAGGANTLSLRDAQANVERIKASDQRFLDKVRPADPNDQKDPGWRPFNSPKDPSLWWESPADRQFWEKHGDRNRLYWWRPDFWLLRETAGWKFLQAVPEGEKLQIGGLSVWDHKWLNTPGEMVIAKDPRYGQIHRFPVYQIQAGSTRTQFAAGEFSNGIWGFYVPMSTE